MREKGPADRIDVPVELYPMGFVVGAGVIGAAFAIGRHFYLDGVSAPFPLPPRHEVHALIGSFEPDPVTTDTIKQHP